MFFKKKFEEINDDLIVMKAKISHSEAAEEQFYNFMEKIEKAIPTFNRMKHRQEELHENFTALLKIAVKMEEKIKKLENVDKKTKTTTKKVR